MKEKDVQHLVRKGGSSAEIAAALPLCREWIKAQMQRCEDLAARRGDILLDGDEKAIAAYKGEVEAARDRLVLLETMSARLKSHQTEAQAREEAARVDAVLADAKAKEGRGVEIIKHYESLANEIGDLMVELYDIHNVIRKAKEVLREARREVDVLQLPERLAAPDAALICELWRKVFLPKPGVTSPHSSEHVVTKRVYERDHPEGPPLRR